MLVLLKLRRLTFLFYFGLVLFLIYWSAPVPYPNKQTILSLLPFWYIQEANAVGHKDALGVGTSIVACILHLYNVNGERL